MTPEQLKDLRSELQRIDGDVKSAATTSLEARFWKVLQIITSVLLCGVMTWGIWVTRSIYSDQLRISKTEDWISNRPSFITSKEADMLKLQIKEDVRIELKPQLDKILETVIEMRMDLKTHIAIETTNKKEMK